LFAGNNVDRRQALWRLLCLELNTLSNPNLLTAHNGLDVNEHILCEARRTNKAIPAIGVKLNDYAIHQRILLFVVIPVERFCERRRFGSSGRDVVVRDAQKAFASPT